METIVSAECDREVKRAHYYTWDKPFVFQYFVMKYLQHKPMYWSKDGALCERMPKGHGVQVYSWFPNWVFSAYCWYHFNIRGRIYYNWLKVTGKV